MGVMFHVYVLRITALTCRKNCGTMQNTSQTERKSSKTPVKVIKPDDLCRVCRCSPAVLGQGKLNLFSTQSKALKLADRLQTVLGQPVHKVSGISSTICYKCKRELERYEKYIQVLEVELKHFGELYRQSVEQFETRSIEVKRCQNLTPSPTTANNSKSKRACAMASPLRPSNSKNIHQASKRQINLNLPADSVDLDIQENTFGHLAVHDDLVVATTPASRTEVFFCQ